MLYWANPRSLEGASREPEKDGPENDTNIVARLFPFVTDALPSLPTELMSLAPVCLTRQSDEPKPRQIALQPCISGTAEPIRVSKLLSAIRWFACLLYPSFFSNATVVCVVGCTTTH